MANTTNAGRCAKPLQRARQLKVTRESDHPMVLRDGRADHMGKGVTVMCSHQRQPVRDNVGLDKYRPTFLVGISTSIFMLAAKASTTEEPREGKLHAGICAGGAG